MELKLMEFTIEELQIISQAVYDKELKSLKQVKEASGEKREQFISWKLQEKRTCKRIGEQIEKALYSRENEAYA